MRETLNDLGSALFRRSGYGFAFVWLHEAKEWLSMGMASARAQTGNQLVFGGHYGL
jgi:hypothetical protein